MKLSRLRGLHHRSVGAVAVAVSGVALFAPAAHAAVPLPTFSAGCAAGPTSEAFSAWGDTNEYELAPGGSFSSASSGWTLTGGAKIVSVSVPLDLGAGTVGALYMPPGSTAQSPSMCVDASDPTYRFIGASVGGTGVSSQAVYTTALGLQVPLTLGTSTLSTSWGPVQALSTGAAPASVVSGGTARMSLRFESQGTSLVDDVFVDPRMHMG